MSIGHRTKADLRMNLIDIASTNGRLIQLKYPLANGVCLTRDCGAS
jgi:hypothetical protein